MANRIFVEMQSTRGGYRGGIEVIRLNLADQSIPKTPDFGDWDCKSMPAIFEFTGHGCQHNNGVVLTDVFVNLNLNITPRRKYLGYQLKIASAALIDAAKG